MLKNVWWIQVVSSDLREAPNERLTPVLRLYGLRANMRTWPSQFCTVPGYSYTGVNSVLGALGSWRASEYVWGFFKIASGCALSGARPLLLFWGEPPAVTSAHWFAR